MSTLMMNDEKTELPLTTSQKVGKFVFGFLIGFGVWLITMLIFIHIFAYYLSLKGSILDYIAWISAVVILSSLFFWFRRRSPYFAKGVLFVLITMLLAEIVFQIFR